MSGVKDGVYRAKVLASPKGPLKRTLEGIVEFAVCAGAETDRCQAPLMLSLGNDVWHHAVQKSRKKVWMLACFERFGSE